MASAGAIASAGAMASFCICVCIAWIVPSTSMPLCMPWQPAMAAAIAPSKVIAEACCLHSAKSSSLIGVLAQRLVVIDGHRQRLDRDRYQLDRHRHRLR